MSQQPHFPTHLFTIWQIKLELAFFLSLRHLSLLLLLGGLVEEGDEVVPVLLLLEPGEHHLRAGDVLLGVRQIHVQGVRSPGDA